MYRLILLFGIIALGSALKQKSSTRLPSSLTDASYSAQFTLFNVASLPKTITFFNFKHTDIEGSVELRSNYPLTCQHNENEFSVDLEETIYLQNGIEHSLKCKMKLKVNSYGFTLESNPTEAKVDFLINYKLEGYGLKAEVDNSAYDFKESVLSKLSPYEKERKRDKLSNDSFKPLFSGVELKKLYALKAFASLKIPLVLTDPATFIFNLERDDIIRFTGPKAGVFANKEDKAAESDDSSTWAIGAVGDIDNIDMSSSNFFDSTTHNGVLVCGIAGKDDEDEFERILFNTYKTQHALITGEEGRVICRINSDRSLYKKRVGSASINIEVLKMAAFNEQVELEHNKALEATRIKQERYTRADTEKMDDVKDYIVSHINALKQKNEKNVLQFPIPICEKKIDGRKLTVKKQSSQRHMTKNEHLVFASLTAGETRAVGGRDCSNATKLVDGKAVFVCGRCAANAIDSSCKGNEGDAFVVVMNKDFTFKKFELDKASNNLSYHSPVVINNNAVIRGNDGVVFVVNLSSGKVIARYDFGIHVELTSPVIINGEALILVGDGKANDPELKGQFAIFIDRNGEVARRVELSGHRYLQPILHNRKIIIPGLYDAKIYVYDEELNLLKIVDLSSYNKVKTPWIRSISVAKDGRYFVGMKSGELLKVNLETGESDLFYQIPAISRTLGLAIEFPVQYLSSGEILVTSNFRGYVLSPDGELKRIIQGGYHPISAPPKLVNFKGEQLIWFSRTSMIHAFDLRGRELYNFDTSDAENSAVFVPFSKENGYLAGMRNGMRFFELYDISLDSQNKDSVYSLCEE